MYIMDLKSRQRWKRVIIRHQLGHEVQQACTYGDSLRLAGGKRLSGSHCCHHVTGGAWLRLLAGWTRSLSISKSINHDYNTRIPHIVLSRKITIITVYWVTVKRHTLVTYAYMSYPAEWCHNSECYSSQLVTGLCPWHPSKWLVSLLPWRCDVCSMYPQSPLVHVIFQYSWSLDLIDWS